jgi:hypothetical protein
VSDDWFGFRTFKRFLRAAIPDGEISGGRQAYLLPPGATTDGAELDLTAAVDAASAADETDEAASAVPAEARRLRRVDPGFPLVETEQWRRIYEHLAEAWRRVGAGTPSTKFVNQLTRSARDRARATGDPLSRRHLDHVVKAVLAAEESGEPLDADQIGDTFASSVLERMAELRIVPLDDGAARARVGRWLLG